MIKRIYCKENFHQNGEVFKKGEIYEVCRTDDDFTGELEIFTSDYKSVMLKTVNGELVDKYKDYFTLIRNCQEEYICKGTFGKIMACILQE